MFKFYKKKSSQENKLYNKILFLSRNKLFYTSVDLDDTFQNRINLIFFHMSFLLIKIKYKDKVSLYKEFYQKLFDHVFMKIELNCREIGYGDVSVNKNMKFLVKVFYDILINCENYKKKSLNNKKLFFNKYLKPYTAPKTTDNADLVKYFDQYQAFCFDLNSDNVLKGDVNFNYK